MGKYIIVFSRHVDNWGAERSTCSLCKGLKDKGYNVLLVIPREGSIINLLNNDDIEYIVHDFLGWLYEGKEKPSFKHVCKRRLLDIINIFSLKRILRKMGIHPMLVYSNTLTFGFGIKFAKSCNVPHVQHIRENIDAFDYHFIDGYEKSMKKINTSSAIMCTCETIRQRYIKDLSPDKFYTVHNGVPPVENLKIKNFNANTLEIIQIARFMDDKRVIDSLCAIKQLVKQGYVNVHLDIYGKGEEEDMYHQFISQNNLDDYVTIKGFVSKIDFSKYHLGLMTSTFEAFARSVLDYMNNGLAVIASNAGGNVEQVANGISGLLYTVKEPVSLAKAIAELYDDRSKLKHFAENSRKRYLDNFTQDRYVAKSNAIILNVLNNGQL